MLKLQVNSEIKARIGRHSMTPATLPQGLNCKNIIHVPIHRTYQNCWGRVNELINLQYNNILD